MSLSLTNNLDLCQVYVSHIWRVIQNSLICIIYKFFVSSGFGKQITHILLILGYNSRLVTWTVVSLTAAMFKPHFLRLASLCPYWCLWSVHLRETLYVGLNRKHNFQQFLYCCVLVHCRGNLFIESLRSTGCLRLSWQNIFKFPSRSCAYNDVVD
jgi:hypothetical protein